MTVTLDLEPDVEAAARAAAQAQGTSVEAYMKALLKRTLLPEESNISLTERLSALHHLNFSAAVMSDYATGRESLYQDHD